MSVTYAKADKGILKAALVVMQRNHEDLAKAGVKLEILMASNSKAEPSLKLHGYPAAGIVGVIDPKSRVLGLGDALIRIATEVWTRLDHKSQEALLDHELRHLDVQFDDDGKVKTDYAGRPVLGMRHHDWHLSGFAETVRLYGAAALDAIEMAAFIAGEHGRVLQPFLPGLSPAASPAEDPDEAVLAQAVDVIRETKRAALGTLQRRLRLTHTQAARVMDHLLERGIVGPPNGNEPREILLDVKSPTASAAA